MDVYANNADQTGKFVSCRKKVLLVGRMILSFFFLTGNIFWEIIADCCSGLKTEQTFPLSTFRRARSFWVTSHSSPWPMSDARQMAPQLRQRSDWSYCAHADLGTYALQRILSKTIFAQFHFCSEFFFKMSTNQTFQLLISSISRKLNINHSLSGSEDINLRLIKNV